MLVNLALFTKFKRKLDKVLQANNWKTQENNEKSQSLEISNQLIKSQPAEI
jgi:hypothetical protein